MTVVIGHERWEGSLNGSLREIRPGFQPQVGLFDCQGKRTPEEGINYSFDTEHGCGLWLDDGEPSGDQPALGSRRYAFISAIPAFFPAFNETVAGQSASPVAPKIAPGTDVRTLFGDGWEIAATTDGGRYPTVGQTLVYTAMAGVTLQYKLFDYGVGAGFADFDCGFDPMLVLFFSAQEDGGPFQMGAWDRTRQFAAWFMPDDNARNGDGEVGEGYVAIDRYGFNYTPVPPGFDGTEPFGAHDERGYGYLQASAVSGGVRLTASNGGASGFALALRDEDPEAGFRCGVVEWDTDASKVLDGFGFTPEYLRLLSGYSGGQKGFDQGIFDPGLNFHSGHMSVGLATPPSEYDPLDRMASFYTLASLGKYQAFDANPLLYARDYPTEPGFVELVSLDEDGFTVATEVPNELPEFSLPHFNETGIDHYDITNARFGYIALRTSPAADEVAQIYRWF